MGNTTLVQGSRAHRRDVMSGDVTPRHINNLTAKPVVAPRRSGEIGRVVGLFVDAQGCRVEDLGHRTFMCAWIGLSNDGKVEAGTQIVKAIVSALGEKVVQQWAMLDGRQPLDLRVKTAQRLIESMDAMEQWEELRLFAAPWLTRPWGRTDDGIGVILTWIHAQQEALVASDAELRDYVAKSQVPA